MNYNLQILVSILLIYNFLHILQYKFIVVSFSDIIYQHGTTQMRLHIKQTYHTLLPRQKQCQNNRRLCTNCINRHNGHTKISIQNLQKLLTEVCIKKQQKRNKIIGLHKAYYVVRTIKQKIRTDLNNMIQIIDSSFSWIESNQYSKLNLVSNIGYSEQQAMKIIFSQASTKQELTSIAIKLNPLNQFYQKQNYWIQNVCKHFQKSLTELGLFIEQDYKHLVDMITNIYPQIQIKQSSRPHSLIGQTKMSQMPPKRMSPMMLSMGMNPMIGMPPMMYSMEQKIYPIRLVQQKIKKNNQHMMKMQKPLGMFESLKKQAQKSQKAKMQPPLKVQTKKIQPKKVQNKQNIPKKQMNGLIKIADIDPEDEQISFVAKVISIESSDREHIKCYLGDETAIVRGNLMKSKHIKKNNYVIITKASVQVHNSHIQIRVSNGNKINEVDFPNIKSINMENNISLKEWVEVD